MYSAILFTWIKVITLFDYCGIDIHPVKFGTPNGAQFDIDPYVYVVRTNGRNYVQSFKLYSLLPLEALLIASGVAY